MSLFEDIKESLIYPFRDRNWVNKLWPLPLLAAIPILGLLSVIILKGWRFEMVRNIANDSEELPNFDLIVMIKRGSLLWAIMLGHIFVPATLCAILGIGGPFGFVADIYEIITSGFESWAKSEPTDWLLTLLIYATWAIISFPVFQAGMIRYSLSGNWKSMLNAPANFLLFVRYIHYFIKFYICWLILSAGIILVDMFLAVTGIGLLIVPVFTVCVYYISSAHELGHLAKKLNKANIEGSVSQESLALEQQ